MTHTEVRWASGSSAFARSTADMFTVGTLTVSWVDTATVAREFAPGTWDDATVFGDDGHPVFTITPTGTRHWA